MKNVIEILESEKEGLVKQLNTYTSSRIKTFFQSSATKESIKADSAKIQFVIDAIDIAVLELKSGKVIMHEYHPLFEVLYWIRESGKFESPLLKECQSAFPDYNIRYMETNYWDKRKKIERKNKFASYNDFYDTIVVPSLTILNGKAPIVIGDLDASYINLLYILMDKRVVEPDLELLNDFKDFHNAESQTRETLQALCERVILLNSRPVLLIGDVLSDRDKSEISYFGNIKFDNHDVDLGKSSDAEMLQIIYHLTQTLGIPIDVMYSNHDQMHFIFFELMNLMDQYNKSQASEKHPFSELTKRFRDYSKMDKDPLRIEFDHLFPNGSDEFFNAFYRFVQLQYPASLYPDGKIAQGQTLVNFIKHFDDGKYDNQEQFDEYKKHIEAYRNRTQFIRYVEEGKILTIITHAPIDLHQIKALEIALDILTRQMEPEDYNTLSNQMIDLHCHHKPEIIEAHSSTIKSTIDKINANAQKYRAGNNLPQLPNEIVNNSYRVMTNFPWHRIRRQSKPMCFYKWNQKKSAYDKEELKSYQINHSSTWMKGLKFIFGHDGDSKKTNQTICLNGTDVHVMLPATHKPAAELSAHASSSSSSIARPSSSS